MAIIKPSMKQHQGGAKFGKASGKAKGGQARQGGGKGGFGGGKGGGGGGKGGGGKGGGGGNWVFVPQAAPAQAWGGRQQQQQPRMAPRAAKGKGSRKGGGVATARFAQAPVVGFRAKGGGKGKGKGKGGGKGKNEDPNHRKNMDKLGTIEAERKVWVGGLPKDVSRGKLVSHFKEVCKPSVLEVMSKGTACIAFKTAEDAESAIASLNGSDLDGSTIEVDVWTQKEKKERKERPEGEKTKKKQTLKIKKDFLKKKPVDSKLKEKLKAVGHELKTWVGGLNKTTTWKQLKTHFTDLGCEVDLVDLTKPGTACVTFKTEGEVASAVSIVNGTDLDGKTIEVDVWTKPVRKEKKQKDED